MKRQTFTLTIHNLTFEDLAKIGKVAEDRGLPCELSNNGLSTTHRTTSPRVAALRPSRKTVLSGARLRPGPAPDASGGRLEVYQHLQKLMAVNDNKPIRRSTLQKACDTAGMKPGTSSSHISVMLQHGNIIVDDDGKE